MGLDCFEPYGHSMYSQALEVWTHIREEFATRLLEEEKVAVVPGTTFGDCGERFS